MNIYKELPIEMKEEIDLKYYNQYVKPLYETLMDEVLMNPYSCEYCGEPAVVFDVYGNLIDLNNLCFNCMVQMQYDEETDSDDYEIGSTTSEDIGVEEVNEGM